jgi:hypothetical protein
MCAVRSLPLVVALVACGPPSWPETAWPGEPEADPATVFSVEPADPIEGEEVILTVPLAPVEGCSAFGATVRREETDGAVVLVAEPASPDMCQPVAVSGGGSLVGLGPLTLGSYVARAGDLELSFVVRAGSTSPGEPPLWWRAAHAVAVTNSVHSSCHDDLGEHLGDRPWRLRAPRLHHQVAVAHPDWDEAAVELAMCIAQSVTVRPVSAREIRYRHSSSTMCHTAESIGTVTVLEDGSLDVGPAYRIDGEDVDC